MKSTTSINPNFDEHIVTEDDIWSVSHIDTSKMFLVNDEGSGGQIYAESPNSAFCYKIQRSPMENASPVAKAHVKAQGLREIANCIEYSNSGITPTFHGVVVTEDGRLGHGMEFMPSLRLLNHMPKEELRLWESRIREFEAYMISLGIGVLGDFELGAVSAVEGQDIDVFDPSTCRMVLIDLTSLHKLSEMGNSIEDAIARNHQSFDIYLYNRMNSY
jgi:hypothetical protein